MVQSSLKVCLIQADLAWKNVKANLAHFESKLDQVNKEVDLYVLPEMFSTGFCMQPEQVAPHAGEDSLGWLVAQARQRGAGFCASVLYRRTDGDFVNRMFLVERDGSYVHYDKRHRFALAKEDQAYSEGDKKPVIAEFRGWKILLQICYDLRFPVFSRNEVNGYDAVIYVANWPIPRRLHWRTLLCARAIENQAYCIGVNRVGKDENGLAYVGDSLVVDPLGKIGLDMQDEPGFQTVELLLDRVAEVRKRLPFLEDADRFILLD